MIIIITLLVSIHQDLNDIMQYYMNHAQHMYVYINKLLVSHDIILMPRVLWNIVHLLFVTVCMQEYMPNSVSCLRSFTICAITPVIFFVIVSNHTAIGPIITFFLILFFTLLFHTQLLCGIHSLKNLFLPPLSKHSNSLLS